MHRYAWRKWECSVHCKFIDRNVSTLSSLGAQIMPSSSTNITALSAQSSSASANKFNLCKFDNRFRPPYEKSICFLSLKFENLWEQDFKDSDDSWLGHHKLTGSKVTQKYRSVESSEEETSSGELWARSVLTLLSEHDLSVDAKGNWNRYLVIMSEWKVLRNTYALKSGTSCGSNTGYGALHCFFTLPYMLKLGHLRQIKFEMTWWRGHWTVFRDRITWWEAQSGYGT